MCIRDSRDITRIVVTDVQPDVAASLSERLPLGQVTPEVVSANEFASMIGDFDVLCTCTSVAPGEGPVVRLDNPKPTLHVNAVGSDFPGKLELARSDLQRGLVMPDFLDQCRIEGECQQLELADVGPSMAEVLSGQVAGLEQRLTIFDSTGWSYEDLVAARLVVGHARQLLSLIHI